MVANSIVPMKTLIVFSTIDRKKSYKVVQVRLKNLYDFVRLSLKVVQIVQSRTKSYKVVQGRTKSYKVFSCTTVSFLETIFISVLLMKQML